jgi:hypothetical protein
MHKQPLNKENSPHHEVHAESPGLPLLKIPEVDKQAPSTQSRQDPIHSPDGIDPIAIHIHTDMDLTAHSTGIQAEVEGNAQASFSWGQFSRLLALYPMILQYIKQWWHKRSN